MSSYCANEGIFRILIWRKHTVSVISSHSEEPVANLNIANLNKSVEEFLPDKKACPDLNLYAIDLKFAQIVAFYQNLPSVKFSD